MKTKQVHDMTIRYTITVDYRADSPERLRKAVASFERTLSHDTTFGHRHGIATEVRDDRITIVRDRVVSEEINTVEDLGD